MEESNSLKILIVEDEKTTGEILKKLLINEGYETKLVNNGEKCLELLKKDKPDLIFLNILLKKVSGIEILKKINELNLLLAIPVVVITSPESIEDAASCVELGATEVISKPFNKTILLARIKGVLKHKALMKKMVELEKIKLLDDAKRLISHEINNPLTVLQANLDILLMKLDKGEKDLTTIKDFIIRLVHPSDEIEYKLIQLQKLDHQNMSFLNPKKGIMGINDILEITADSKKIFFHWREQFNIGFETIDTHHRKIADFINQLYHAKETDQERDTILQIIQNLINYTEFHFSYEEIKFSENNYENESEHKELHQAFTTEVNIFHEKVKIKDLNALSNDIMIFLKEWLLKHILVEDKKYINYFKENGYN